MTHPTTAESLLDRIERIREQAGKAMTMTQYTAAGEKAIRLLPEIASALCQQAAPVEDATDEFVPRWWDDSHGAAYKEGWNDCRATLLAAIAKGEK